MREFSTTIIASALIALVVLLANYRVLVRAGDAVQSLMRTMAE